MGNTNRDQLCLIKHAKSNLLETAYTEQDRSILGTKLDALINKDIIRKYGKINSPVGPRDTQDVIADFLTKVFEHTKQQLSLLHGFSDQCPVQFVLTVPTMWSTQSSRILQAAMQDSLRATEFGVESKGAIENLFIISEPEAAATYIIKASAKVLVSSHLEKLLHYTNSIRSEKPLSFWTAAGEQSMQ